MTKPAQGSNPQCMICQDPIVEGSSKRFCTKVHFRDCLNCQEPFEVKKVGKPPVYCSAKCSAADRSFETVEKDCKICGVKFSPNNPRTKFCSTPHPMECLECHSEFMLQNPAKPRYFCSQKCTYASKKRDRPEAPAKAQTATEKIPKYELNCSICGESFRSSNPNSKYCKNAHMVQCSVCGEDFDRSPVSEAESCSKKCAAKLVDFTARNEKTKETFRAKSNGAYENASQDSLVKAQKLSTLQTNYGVDSPLESPEVKAKFKSTSMERYGVENPAQSAAVREKIRATNLERYGVDNTFKRPEIKARIEAINLERYGVKNAFQTEKSIRNAIAAGSRRVSRVNIRWEQELKSLGVDVELETRFGEKFSADLGMGSILLDINPSITHSSSISFVHFRKSCKVESCSDPRHGPTDPLYHQKRFLAAESEGKTLLQHFDWQDEAIFKSIVLSKLHASQRRVAAKKCEVREVSQRDANRFFKENHLLGAASGQSFCVGLFFDGELIHCHSFGPARLNRSFQWEAIRSCSKMGWQVQGGFSRADSLFFRSQEPESVVSYADLAIGNGSTEANNPGWELISTNRPSATWVYLGSLERLRPKQPLFVKEASARKLSADRLLGLGIGEKYPSHHGDGRVFSNSDVLQAEGYVQVFDAGTRTFGWKREESHGA